MTTTAIKEKPILFSGPMVKAILAGTKSQTRRVVSANNSTVLGYPAKNYWHMLSFDYDGGEGGWRTQVDGPNNTPYGCGDNVQYLHVPSLWESSWDKFDPEDVCRFRVRPIYEVGMRLWVREAWCEYGDGPIYRADYGQFTPISDGIGGPWQPSIFMPRRFSRITLEITEVRVQRIQEINDEDCYAEGCVTQNPDEPQVDFQELWDSLNAKRGHGWSQNPWVWAISFRRATEQ